MPGRFLGCCWLKIESRCGPLVKPIWAPLPLQGPHPPSPLCGWTYTVLHDGNTDYQPADLADPCSSDQADCKFSSGKQQHPPPELKTNPKEELGPAPSTSSNSDNASPTSSASPVPTKAETASVEKTGVQMFRCTGCSIDATGCCVQGRTPTPLPPLSPPSRPPNLRQWGGETLQGGLRLTLLIGCLQKVIFVCLPECPSFHSR